jgi:hypothetical protein
MNLCRDIRQENRMNRLTTKKMYQDCRILTPQQIELLFTKM